MKGSDQHSRGTQNSGRERRALSGQGGAKRRFGRRGAILAKPSRQDPSRPQSPARSIAHKVAQSLSLSLLLLTFASCSILLHTIWTESKKVGDQATNEAPTITNPIRTFTVQENAISIGTISGSDPNASDTLTFGIASALDNAGRDSRSIFTMDSARGIITVESGSLKVANSPYTLVITLSDGHVQTPVMQTFVLTVTEVTRNTPPTISPQTFANVPLGASEIGTVMVSDPDTADTLTFTIPSAKDKNNANVGSLFSISKIANTTNAHITTSAGMLNAESSPYTITVEVSDGVNPAVTADMRVEVNSPPVIDSSLPLTASTSLSVGRSFGSVSASDPDAGDSLTYRLVSAYEGDGTNPGTAVQTTIFALDQGTGQISLARGMVDNAKKPYTIVVAVSDGHNPPVEARITVQVTVANQAPTILPATFRIAETQSAAENFATITANDPESAVLSFSISSNANDNNGHPLFELVSTGDNSAALRLAAGRSLSYSNTPAEHSIQISVSDGETTPATATFTIDVNRAPKILAGQSRSIAEGTGGNIAIGTALEADDPDSEDVLTYEIISANPPSALSLYRIEASTGQLRTLGTTLDFETTPSATLTIRVQDTGVGRLTHSEEVEVKLTNVNEAPSIGVQSRSVEENHSGNFAAVLTAQDPDAGDSLRYSISRNVQKGGSDLFAISSGGQLSISSQLDYESDTAFRSTTITVEATDVGGLSDTAEITITLTDVNEAPTIFAQNLQVAENHSGNFGSALTANDPDAGDALSFRITSNVQKGGSDLFAITSTGQLSITSALDYETDTSFRSNTITVEVSDRAGKRASADITISILNVGENSAPSITAQTRQIAENKTGNVGTPIVASDPDTGDSLSYSITSNVNKGGLGLFAIQTVNNTGQLVLISSLDYEADSAYRSNSITVRVTDSGGLTADATITITLADANEAPSIGQQSLQIAENASGNIGSALRASDPDSGDSLRYSISRNIRRNGSDLFAIDSGSGQLRITSALDYESDSAYRSNTITVRATDRDGLFAEANITITLTDANEAPLITNQSRSIAENVTGNIGSPLTARDPDAGNTLSFSITSNVQKGGSDLFGISSSGQLILNSALNYETDSTFRSNTITVRATDAGGLYAEATITIALTDANEAPNFNRSSYSFTINEAARTIGTVTASDPDAGDSLTYSIVSATRSGGSSANIFTIDSSSGGITASSGSLNPNHSPYTITVRATDSASLSATATVTVGVTENAILVWESDFSKGISQFYNWGSPAPFVDSSGGGRSNVLDPNGDINWESGVVFNEPAAQIYFQPGISIKYDFYLNTTNNFHHSIGAGLIRSDYTVNPSVSEGIPIAPSFGGFLINPSPSTTNGRVYRITSFGNSNSPPRYSNLSDLVVSTQIHGGAHTIDIERNDPTEWKTIEIRVITLRELDFYYNNQYLFRNTIPDSISDSDILGNGNIVYPFVYGRSNDGNDLVLIDNIRVSSLPLPVEQDKDQDSIANSIDVDDDNDGLIEITGSTMAEQLTMLHNMRHNLVGTSYKTSAEAAGNTLGAPTTATPNCPTDSDGDGTFLCGYELTGNLTFDTGSNGTWSNTGTDDAPVYSLDSADNASPYFVTADGGWLPIGTANSDGNRFTAVFEGNGHSITGLAVQRNLTNVGMFGVMGAGAEVRNLGLIRSLADYSGSSSNAVNVGGLVGYQTGGQVTASYSTGNADGGAGGYDYVGGLIGWQGGGQVTASYSTGNADGGSGYDDRLGGLVGYQTGGQVTASYSTGSVNGGAGGGDRVGGLIGWQRGGQVTASYFTGSADGGAGSEDFVGGLVGFYSNIAQVTASYSTGSADGGAGHGDIVGGLVGLQAGGQVTASYSSGNANGGADGRDLVGSFIGWQSNGLTTPVTSSYGFGTVDGETTSGMVTLSGTAGIAGIAGTSKPAGVTRPANLTASKAGTQWNRASNNTAGAWDFGSATQTPALNYADYDGSGNAYHCDNAPNPPDGTIILPCSIGEIPNQVRTIGTLSLSLANGNFTSAQTLQITYSAVASEMPDSILYTFTTDGSEPADPSLPANMPTSYTLGTNIPILATANSRYRIRAIARRGGLTSTEITGIFTRFPANDIDGDGVRNAMDVDDDNDGLIEIADATQFNNIRYNLQGTSYDDELADTSTGDTGSSLGCPVRGCNGYELMANINLSSYTHWIPMGSEGGTVNAYGSEQFTGIFEGNNYSIQNLTINSNAYAGTALFQRASASEFRNFSLTSVNITRPLNTTWPQLNRVGSLVADAINSTIDNVHVSGTISVPSARCAADVGGISGVFRSDAEDELQIVYSSSNVDITTNLNIGSLDCASFNGGLVGLLESSGNSIIQNSFARGDIDANSTHGANVFAGGLVGRIYGEGTATISNSYVASASITASSTGSSTYGSAIVGGLIGQVTENINLSVFRSYVNVPEIDGMVQHNTRPLYEGTIIGNNLANNNAAGLFYVDRSTTLPTNAAGNGTITATEITVANARVVCSTLFNASSICNLGSAFQFNTTANTFYPRLYARNSVTLLPGQ